MSRRLGKTMIRFCIPHSDNPDEACLCRYQCLVCLCQSSDPDHWRIRIMLQTFQGRLITSTFIFDETVTLCLYRLGRQVAATVGEVLRDPTVVAMLRITPEDEQQAWVLWLARPDKIYSFTDCTSFVLMRRLGCSLRLLSIRISNGKASLLLPSPS